MLRLTNIFLAILNIFLIFTTENEEIDYSKRLMNLNDFEYIIPQKCELHKKKSNDKIPSLVVLIHSAPLHSELRDALRETWISFDQHVLSYFMLGRTHSKALQDEINKENHKYNDIVQGNFIDSYHNLTYKHIMALKWFSSECNTVKYLLRIDDDVFANIPEVLDYLKKIDSKNPSVIGAFRGPTQVGRGGKGKVTRQQYKENIYPEVALGPVIYSNKFVKAANEKSHTTRFFWIDDVLVTGLIRQQLFAKVTGFDGPHILSHDETHFFTRTDKDPGNFSKPHFLFSQGEILPNGFRLMWKKVGIMRRRLLEKKGSA